MNRRKKILIGIVIIITISCVIIAASDKDDTTGLVLFTMTSNADNSENFGNLEYWRFNSKSRIASFNMENPDQSLKVLTNDFYSARSPEVRYDAEKILFSGKLSENDPWQIWEMNLGSKDYKKIISRDENCTDPIYLPDGKILYTVQEVNQFGTSISTLYACHSDGCCEHQLTFHPHTDFSPTMQKDGRVLMISRQVYPETRNPMFLAMRPDGTKAELYYKGEENTTLISRGWETADNRFVFVESEINKPGNGMLVSISKNRPLHSRLVHSKEINGNFHSVFPLSEDYLVSYQESPSDPYGLYKFDPTTNKLGEKLISETDYHCIEPVLIAERPLPRKLPSPADTKTSIGSMVCLDVNLSDILPAGNNSGNIKTETLRVLGIDQTIKELPVEADGSFSIEMPADTPVRFQTLDRDGNILRGPSAWVWIRPNERRGCVGCHENREYAPENKVPLAIDKEPVSLLSDEESKESIETDH